MFVQQGLPSLAMKIIFLIGFGYHIPKIQQLYVNTNFGNIGAN